MNIEQIDQFRSEFKSIVYKKGFLKNLKQNIEKLSRYDRDGSHSKAIEKAILTRNKYRNEEYTPYLKGYKYEEWLAMSREITVIKSRLKALKVKDDKLKNQISTKIKYFNL